MADKDDKGKGPRSLEDLEAEVDKMEKRSEGGETVESTLGTESDDLEVVFVPGAREKEGDDVPEEPAEGQQGGEVPEEGEAPEGEADLANYSKNVRSRIRREIRLKEDAETREQAERELRVNAQREAHSSQVAYVETSLALMDTKIKETEGKLKAAKEGGKTDDEIAATGELADLKSKRNEIERAQEHLKTQKQAQPNPLVHAWERENRWFGNAEFQPETMAVRSISAQLAQKYPPNTPEHFREVDRELQRRMPNLAARVRARLGQDAIRWQGSRNGAKQDEEPARGGPRLAAPGGGFGRSNSSGKRLIELDKSDLEAMRRVRLNPENKEHVLQYAREKAALNRR